MSELVLLEKHDGFAVITFNRPEAMNAMSTALLEQLDHAFREIQSDKAIRVAVLTGNGRAWCAGYDLNELAGISGDNAEAMGEGGGGREAMEAFDGPIIGAINGYVITGGFEMALACDLLYASTTAKFADTHARIGILPGWGLSQKLQRLIGQGRAKELSLSGNMLDAATACEWGLVNRVFEPDELLAAACQLARDIAGTIPGTMRAYRQLIDEGAGMTLADALAHEQRACVESARGVSSDDIATRRGGMAAHLSESRDRD
jgi:enoyl-CoA hydratase